MPSAVVVPAVFMMAMVVRVGNDATAITAYYGLKCERGVDCLHALGPKRRMLHYDQKKVKSGGAPQLQTELAASGLPRANPRPYIAALY